MEFSDWLARRLKELGLKQKNIVDATGASKGTVSLWVKGGSYPSRQFLSPLATILQIDVESLVEMIGSYGEDLYKNSPAGNISTAVREVNDIKEGAFLYLARQVPILNSTQATRAADSIAAGDVEGFLGVQSDMLLGKDAFYYRLDDDSMVSADRDTFRKGALVLIDPDLPIEPGMFVLAKVMLKGVETAVFRAYFEREEIDGFESFDLVPINRAVKTIRVERPEDGQILGGLAMVSMPATDMRYG